MSQIGNKGKKPVWLLGSAPFPESRTAAAVLVHAHADPRGSVVANMRTDREQMPPIHTERVHCQDVSPGFRNARFNTERDHGTQYAAGTSRGVRNPTTGYEPRTGMMYNNLNHGLPWIDFPKFSGIGLQGWLKKCQRFFMLNPIYIFFFLIRMLNPIEENQIVPFVSIHLEGKADHWFQFNYNSLDGLTWERFIADLSDRFSETGLDDVIARFKKLQQTNSVEEYQSLNNWNP